jgi:hypothetical protein
MIDLDVRFLQISEMVSCTHDMSICIVTVKKADCMIIQD